MGDKTQLAPVALAAEFNTVTPVWLGTTGGILVADAVGIILGIVLHKKIAEKQIKWFAATMFIAFGVWGLYESLINALLMKSF
jgi:putative Ca2+/H+ antiporter (TMEM165/GDT1 family)